MATAVEKRHGKPRVHGESKSTIEGVGSPISNKAYNVIAALHAKLEGLEAYRKYAKDSDSQIWRELTKAELKTVDKLIGELERLVEDGELRMNEPGETGH